MFNLCNLVKVIFLIVHEINRLKIIYFENHFRQGLNYLKFFD